MTRDTDKDNTRENSEVETTAETTNPGRRRLVKGVIAAPVLLTVVSRPAMGAKNFCTPSGFLSGNLSTPEVSCNGRSPGYWRNRFPSAYETTTYSEVFGGVWHDQTGVPWDAGTTLYEVLHMAMADDQYKFGFHSVACYFNAVYKDQLGYYMEPSEVVDIVQQILTFGVYQDLATGLTMDAIDVVNFFKGTYH